MGFNSGFKGLTHMSTGSHVKRVFFAYVNANLGLLFTYFSENPPKKIFFEKFVHWEKSFPAQI